MAAIRPFRGLRYNPTAIADLATVVSQPYDRIERGLQESYYALSPYNIVRIIKGREEAGDGEENSVYTRARDCYRAWLRDGIFARDPEPALYVLRQTFPLPDGTIRTRQGLVAALRLARFDEGVVLPHERTHSGPKMDRLLLTRATRAYWGHVFILYPGDGINGLLERAIEATPGAELRELHEREVAQRFWRVSDPAAIAALVEEMAPKRKLIIADGHHRYETALSYRDEMRTAHPEARSDQPYDYCLATLVSMDDPGLAILPTHRLIHSYGRMGGTELLDRARAYFDVQQLNSRAELDAELTRPEAGRPRFGFYDGRHAVLALRDPRVLEQLLPGRAPAWRLLDVTVLHELLIERVLGIDKGTVERKEHIEYLRDPQDGYAAVARGEAQFLLLVNPTRIEQVRACADADERMPQKSTDFYPKVISGLVIMELE